MKLLELSQQRSGEISLRLQEHIQLAAGSTLLAVVIGLTFALLAQRQRVLKGPVLAIASTIQTIPSLALLTLLLPLMGIGVAPAMTALTLYAILPALRSAITGLQETPPASREMARALGMSPMQCLLWIEFRYAAPYVIAGIRTAAVISVGIATLSAFVGAGGLGVFINRGLALSNTDLLLLGAIPAALLALYVDMLLGILERFFQPGSNQRLLGGAMMGIVLLGIGIVWALQGAGTPTASTNQETRSRTITVGSKNFTEQLILGEIISTLLEKSGGYTVQRRLNLAGSAVCHKAIVDGSIDLYVEYTGTALTSVLKSEVPSDPAEAFASTRAQYKDKFNLTWLDQLGFANTYALVVRKDLAQEQGWQTISDFKSAATKLKGAFTSEFLERDDGWPGLRDKYGLRIAQSVDMEPTIMYEALDQGQVDVISGFSTDGRIAAYDLLPLADNLRFFPPYDAAIVVRQQVLNDEPEIRAILESLSGKIDEATMQRLNYEVDGKKRTPREVASEFLRTNGYLPED